jgi:hypothetical protein
MSSADWEYDFDTCVDSDDESSQSTTARKRMSLETACKCEIRFGRFKGSSIGAMLRLKDSRDYLRYLLKWPDLRPYTRTAIDTALEAYKNRPNQKKKAQKKRRRSALQSPKTSLQLPKASLDEDVYDKVAKEDDDKSCVTLDLSSVRKRTKKVKQEEKEN